MKNRPILALISLMLASCGSSQPVAITPQKMEVSSPVFENGQTLPTAYTCDGKGARPPLAISGVPDSARSLAVIYHDPDAPAGYWLHWSIWNIPSGTRLINEENLPPGAVEGKTSFGRTGYGPPCPPSGTHHYIFDVYALDSILNLPSGTDRQTLMDQIGKHILQKTTLTGLYRRTKI